MITEENTSINAKYDRKPDAPPVLPQAFESGI